MPLYEYECKNGHRFEVKRPIDRRHDEIHCQDCRAIARLVMSLSVWRMGFEWLKTAKMPDVPTDAGYHQEFDQAYSPAGDIYRKA